MTLVEPSSTSTIPTHRRRLSLKTLLNPFRHSLDASAHATRAAQPTSTDPRADEAVSASPLERTSTKASSTAPKKLRRRSLSHLVKPSKPSVTKGERVDDAAAPTSTWAKRTLGHPLPPMPTSHKTEGAAKDDKSRLETARQPLRAEQRPSLPAPPLVIELDVRKGAPSTYSPPPPAVDRPSGGDLPMRTALPFPSRPKPASASAQHSAASLDVKHERVASSSDPPRPQLSANSSQSSQSSVDLLAWRFPTPPLRYHSSPDSSVSSTPSSSPRRVDPTAKLAPASPPAGRNSSRPPAVQHRRPSSTPAEPLEHPPPSPSGSPTTTTRKPITIRPQLGGPRVSASLLAKGIPVPAPAHGGGLPRPSNSSSSTSGRSPVQPGWSATTSTGWPRPLLLVEGAKGSKGGELRHSRSQSVGAPSSRGRGRSTSRAQAGSGELRERDKVESDGMGAERRRYVAEADTMFTDARLKSLWSELGL